MSDKPRNSVIFNKYSWYNFFRPSSEDIAFIKQKYPFLHHLDLETCLSAKTQRPKVDLYPNYVFFVLHLPFFDQVENQIKVSELNVFLGEDFIITLYHEDFRRLKRTFSDSLKSPKKAQSLLLNGTEILFFQLFRKEITNIFPLLDAISLRVENIDHQLFSGTEKDLVMQIFKLRRDIVVLKTSITPHIQIFEQMESRAEIKKDQSATYWGILADNLRRISDRIENNRELINGLSSTMESFLSYRTNEIIKVLTIFSVILLPLTFITGAYGMNLIKLPLANHPYSFWIIILGMMSLVGSMIFFFKKKKWF